MISNPRLMARLDALSLDDLDAAFPFSRRLARDNGWSHGYALRVIEEYKRFAYLAAALDREVTPSDEVDQAWHLHLCYTRHYWGPFAEALGRPLHHGPTAGGATEDARYADNYDATRAAYEREFGESPPDDIWPAPEIRFGDAAFMRRLNISDKIILKKSAIARYATGAGALALGGLAAGYAIAQEGDAGGGPNPAVWIALFAVFVSLAVVFGSRFSAASKAKKSSNAGGGVVGGCGTSGGKGGDGDGGSDGGSGCSGGGCGGGCGG